jgi:hypothetical protein
MSRCAATVTPLTLRQQPCSVGCETPKATCLPDLRVPLARSPPVVDKGPPPSPGVAADKGTLLNSMTEAACRHGPSGLPNRSEGSWRS